MGIPTVEGLERNPFHKKRRKIRSKAHTKGPREDGRERKGRDGVGRPGEARNGHYTVTHKKMGVIIFSSVVLEASRNGTLGCGLPFQRKFMLGW